MFLLILLVSLAFRLLIAPTGFHIDIISNAGWGMWITAHGPLGFYTNNIWTFAWPTQPPFVSLLYGFDSLLYSWLLEAFRKIGNMIVLYHIAPWHLRFWFEFTKWFDTAKISDESAFTTGYLTTIKILPILADLFIASIIYKIAKFEKNKFPLLWSTLYLISPFSWYLSALWGQYDQLSYLFLLIASILVSNKKLSVLTPFIFAVSIAVKPTALILLPFFIYIYIKNTRSKISYIISAILIILFFYTTTKVFTLDNPINFTKDVLINKIFYKSGSRLTANAFNFWRIIVGNRIESADFAFLFIPAKWWSYSAFFLFNFLAIKKIKKINIKNVMTGIFIISAGSWLFMTNMLDRYFFAGVATGLILSVFDRRILKYWIILSIIFWINLYNQWWFPDFLQPLHNILAANNAIITRLLALINVITFAKILQISLKK